MSPIDLFFEKLLGASDEFLKHEETRHWPAVAGLLLVGIANAFLSDSYHFFGLSWLVIIVIIFFIAMVAFLKRKGNHDLVHTILTYLCVALVILEIYNIGHLILTLPDKTIPAVTLLVNAGILWISNVIIFGYWYWEIEGGGPMQRSLTSPMVYHKQAELLFPQLTLIDQRPEYERWRPGFLDYLFVAFNTSTAFSPTDTAVLTQRLKALSMLQSLLSLVTLATLAARAVNIL
ncbi:MAG: hypothetical protein BGO39_25485 [Chloroflexi bacterium 54-19]|nr:MAG: hypothetical protein BGO39_25485 [Chloroflexi bacterium 54-19]